MDNDTMNDLRELLKEIGTCLKKAKELIGEADSSGNKLKILVEVDRKGGIVTKDEWQAIGEKYGVDARGLGGFFVGSGSMTCIGGEKRALTERGMKMIKKWKENSEQKEQK